MRAATHIPPDELLELHRGPMWGGAVNFEEPRAVMVRSEEKKTALREAWEPVATELRRG